MSDSIFILANPLITIGTESAMFTISVIALLLNCLVIYIMVFYRKCKKADTYLIIFIALVDILIAITVIITQTFKWFTFHQILINPWFCQFSGMIYMLLTLTSVDGIGILSLVRALAVVKNITIWPLYWYFLIGLLSALNTLLSAVGLISQIMRVMPSQAYCQPSYRKSLFSQIYSAIMIGKLTLMLVIIIISYICITIKHCKLLAQLNAPMKSTSVLSMRDIPALVFNRGIVSRLLMLVLMYMICFLPEIITTVYNISTRTERAPIPDAVSCTAMNLTILANSIFVLFYHEETRTIVLSLLPSWLYFYRNNRDNYELSSF